VLLALTSREFIMDWKEYEEEIHQIFQSQYPNCNILYDVERKGVYSKVNRQIDILIEEYVAGNRFSIAIDCKYFNKRVDVKGVEAFIGMLEDFGANKGLLITKDGFSEAALNRAHFGPSEIELDIFNFKDLYKFQGYGGIPYRRGNGVLVPAPFGWVIDSAQNPLGIATFYQRGFTLEEAVKKKEFMYVQIWNKETDNKTLDDLLKIQDNGLLNTHTKTEIEFIPTIRRNDARVVLRAAKVPSYPTTEYTGLIEFDKFIFFCVLFTPENRSRQNIKKLENILERALPLNVQQEANNSS